MTMFMVLSSLQSYNKSHWFICWMQNSAKWSDHWTKPQPTWAVSTSVSLSPRLHITVVMVINTQMSMARLDPWISHAVLRYATARTLCDNASNVTGISALTMSDRICPLSGIAYNLQPCSTISVLTKSAQNITTISSEWLTSEAWNMWSTSCERKSLTYDYIQGGSK